MAHADDVERVGAPDRVRTALGDHGGDPVGGVRAHVCDQLAPLVAELVEEPSQRRGVAAGGGPHQPAGVVVDHDGQVAMTLLITDLVHAETAQPGEAVGRGQRVVADPAHDRPDGPPGDAHQIPHRALRAAHGQPGDLVVETVGVPSAVPRPRDGGHHHPVLGAAHPGGVGLHHHLHGAQVQRPPPAPPGARVIAGAAPPAHPAARPLRGNRPHVRHDGGLGRRLVELHPLHHSPLDPEQSAP